MMTRASLLYLVAPLAFAACAMPSSSSQSDDNQIGAPGDDLPLAPADPAKLAATRFGTTTPLTQWQAGDVAFGSSASITATITNVGGSPTNALHAALAGANLSQFSIDAEHSSCEGTILAPAAQCQLVLVFTPVAPTTGMRVAQVNVSGAPTLLQIGMHGNGVLPSNSIVVNPTALDFGGVDLEQRADRNVVVTNTGTGTVSLSRPTVGRDSVYEVAAFDCGDTLAPGASCTVTVQLAPVHVGTSADQLTIVSAANSPAVTLTGVGQRMLTVNWTGSGQITALPNNLTCAGTTCTGHFPGDIAVTAVAAPGGSFVGWSPLCGVNPTCTLPADDTPAITLNATFAP